MFSGHTGPAFLSRSKPFIFPKMIDTDRHNGNTDHDECRIGPGLSVLRHIKVHAVPAGDERERQSHSGDHGKKLHKPVEADIHLGLVGFPHLGDIIP